MRQLLVMLLAFMVSCNSRETAKEHENKAVHDKDLRRETTSLRNGAKWKADETTKKNVAAMALVAAEPISQDAGKRTQLAAAMQSQLDTLIKQCRMKGAEHDALHAWLEKVLRDVKTLKDEKGAYAEIYAALNKDISSFYDLFE